MSKAKADMDRLWAPWRVSYIRGKKQKKCIFCRDTKNTGNQDYVLFSTKYSTCRLNIFPYNNGHVMVAPKRHIADPAALKQGEALDLFRALTRAKGLLDKVLKPGGYNIGINLFAVAGAGIPGHLHIHVVPRWKGDTNFMPVVFDTKVVSQSLDELYRQLKAAG
jgi:ATP adenylyltransferase